jgi:hypothetical protein
VETIDFLEDLVRALGHGWSARYGMIAPYGVFGVTLTSDVGGAIEVVPSLVRGEIVVWSPFVFARGTPTYDLHIDGQLVRTPVLAEAVARLDRWRRERGPAGRMAARFARVAPSRPRRSARTTEVDDLTVTPAMGLPAVTAPPRSPVGRGPAAPVESLAEALRGKKLGQIERARKLARQRGHDQAVRELYAIAKRASGDARANALGVLVAVARPQDGAELARYLGDPERSVQSVAVDGVKRTGYAAAVPALAALVVDRDARRTSARSQLAASAATAMKALSGKRGLAALTGYLTSDDPRVREAACVALTMSGGPATKRTRPMLERLLGDDDARVVKAARRALAAR